jgi:hypothetical protein
MANEMRNQSPRTHYEIARNRFFQAYHQSTSGSQGGAILKWLHEDMNVMEESPHFSALERAAEVLQGLEQKDPHPMLYSQVIGAFEALIQEWRDKDIPISHPLWVARYDDGLTSLDDWNTDILGGKL